MLERILETLEMSGQVGSLFGQPTIRFKINEEKMLYPIHDGCSQHITQYEAAYLGKLMVELVAHHPIRGSISSQAYG